MKTTKVRIPKWASCQSCWDHVLLLPCLAPQEITGWNFALLCRDKKTWLVFYKAGTGLAGVEKVPGGGKQQKGSRTVWYQYSSTGKEKERKEKKKKMEEKNEDESSTELSPWCSSMRANRWPSSGSLGRKARASSIESRCDGCLPNTAWISENR